MHGLVDGEIDDGGVGFGFGVLSFGLEELGESFLLAWGEVFFDGGSDGCLSSGVGGARLGLGAMYCSGSGGGGATDAHAEVGSEGICCVGFPSADNWFWGRF